MIEINLQSMIQVNLNLSHEGNVSIHACTTWQCSSIHDLSFSSRWQRVIVNLSSSAAELDAPMFTVYNMPQRWAFSSRIYFLYFVPKPSQHFITFQLYRIHALILPYSGKVSWGSYLQMVTLDHLVGLIFMVVHTHTHYALHYQVYFACLIFIVVQSSTYKLRKLDPE